MKKVIALFILIISMLLHSLPSFSQTWTKIDCGTEFNLALKSDGTLWSWGYNANGQLGIGNTTTQNIPTQIGTDNDWTDIAAGAVHSLAVKSNGTLWSWGGNGVNQLGNGNTNDATAPIQLGNATDWKTVDAGQAHSFAIKTNGTLWGWGYNSSGQVGNGTMVDVSTPVQIGLDTDWNEISSGGWHTMALKNDSTLWAWGSNANGELGLGNTNSEMFPTQVGSQTDWIAISAGFQFCMALRQGGGLWAWGFNGNDQLGDDGLGTTVTSPTTIEPTQNWKKIAAGPSFAYAIKNDGGLYSWGFNNSGQLGQGNTINVSTVTQVGTDTDWEDVQGAEGLFANNSVFGLHGLAMKNGRTVICAAGSNFSGQLGNGTMQDNLTFDCSTGNLAVGLNDKYDLSAITIYPNPTSGIINVELPDFNGFVNLELFSIEGKSIIMQQTKERNAIFDGSALPKGVYLLRIKHQDQAISRKVIIQ